MPSNSTRMIHESRQMFEEMLRYVTDEKAGQATADQIERGLFRMLLRVGAQLLHLFFVRRSEQSDRQTPVLVKGEAVPYHQEKKRNYVSLFGVVPLVRPYFYRVGVGGTSPLDGELNLGERSYSDLVCELAERLGVQSAYQEVSVMLSELLGLSLSSRVVQASIAQDAGEVLAYYAQKAPPPVASEAAILVIQADGKGVPVLREAATTPIRLGKGEKRGHKKEAIVTALYTIAPVVRTAQAVVTSLYRQGKSAPSAAASVRTPPQNKQLAATLAGKDVALARLRCQVARRQGTHIQHQVALCDGCEALQSRLQQTFPDFTLVLDLIHANEYLWQVATALHGESSPQRLPWMQRQTLRLLAGETHTLLQEFNQLAQASTTTSQQRQTLLTTSRYLERNLPFMDYPIYLAHGWPIASGVIEGACRHLVKDRCERSGMRWSLPGAESLLRLRAVAENGDWSDFHAFRRKQRQLRLYHLPQAPTAPPEQLMLAT